ncbi:MAG: hypothetical protein IIA64_01750 [Planctomycetes bacterium]|nr:hypothetical protein [Planctomycetota bacterium]
MDRVAHGKIVISVDITGNPALGPATVQPQVGEVKDPVCQVHGPVVVAVTACERLQHLEGHLLEGNVSGGVGVHYKVLFDDIDLGAAEVHAESERCFAGSRCLVGNLVEFEVGFARQTIAARHGRAYDQPGAARVALFRADDVENVLLVVGDG